jgi:hypothetical protein
MATQQIVPSEQYNSAVVVPITKPVPEQITQREIETWFYLQKKQGEVEALETVLTARLEEAAAARERWCEALNSIQRRSTEGSAEENPSGVATEGSCQNLSENVTPPKLTVVPFPAQPVTQLELMALLSLRGRLHQLEEQVETAESSIKNRLEAGCPVEQGDHTAKLNQSFRRNVSWKDVAVRLANKLYFDA